MTDSLPPYYVQGETVRGEPRVYWVEDRETGKSVTEVTRDRRTAERWCEKLVAALGESVTGAKDDRDA